MQNIYGKERVVLLSVLNPTGRFEMASPAEDSLQGWKGDKGNFWEPQKLPPIPATQTVPRESKYLRSSHRLELEGEAVGGLSPCGHSSGERGLGGHPWQTQELPLTLALQGSSERWYPPTTSHSQPEALLRPPGRRDNAGGTGVPRQLSWTSGKLLRPCSSL